jgi:hypothetical protein
MEWPAVADLIHRGPWYKNRGIVMLNLCLALSLITSYTSGFDGIVYINDLLFFVSLSSELRFS